MQAAAGQSPLQSAVLALALDSDTMHMTESRLKHVGSKSSTFGRHAKSMHLCQAGRFQRSNKISASSGAPHCISCSCREAN